MLLSNADRKLLELQASKLKVSPDQLEDEVCFLIDTNYIAHTDRGIDDDTCRSKLIEFFQRKDHWINIQEVLYNMYPAERTKNLTAQEAYNVIIGDPGFKHSLNRYHFNILQGLCLDLCAGITLKRDNYVDRDFFDFFFAFRLSRRELERVRDFLAYTLYIHFNGDINEFSYTLSAIIIPKYKDLIGEDKLRILTMLTGDEVITNKAGSEGKQPVKPAKSKFNILSDIFVCDFNSCLKVLKEVDPPVIDDNNKFILGNKSIGALVAWKDVLERRGKMRINEYNDEQLAQLLREYFKTSLAGRTLRANKTKAYEKYYKDFLALIK